MTKKDNFFNDLMRVDIPSGRLRLAILVVLLFFIWSLCAIATSIIHPFNTLPAGLSTGLLPGAHLNGNLATSLFRDILNSYLSLYAVAYLSLIIASILITHRIVKQLIQLVYPKIKRTRAANFLQQSALSTSDYALIHISAEDTLADEDLILYKTLGGPAYIQIEPELSVITRDSAGACRKVPTNLPEDEAFFLHHQEKIASIARQERILFLTNFHAICKDGMPLNLASLRLTYTWLHEALDSKGMQDIARVMQGQDAQALLLDLIKNEMRALFLNFNHIEIQHHLGAPDDLTEKAIHPAPVSHRRHNIPKHARLYSVPGKFFHQAGSSIILRNRRRSLYPELHADDNRNADMPIEDPPDFVFELSNQLSQSVNAIFGSHVLNIKIENIGKVSRNAIY